MPLAALIGFLLLAAAPASGPEHFFVGRTEGEGVVNVLLTGRHGVRDHSRGRMEREGVLVIDQVIEEEGKPARRRNWRLVRTGPNRFTGTISDARGPIAGDISGNVMHLTYRLVEGHSVEQWIAFQPGGRTASNRMTFRRFGLRVATLDGTIRRLD